VRSCYDLPQQRFFAGEEAANAGRLPERNSRRHDPIMESHTPLACVPGAIPSQERAAHVRLSHHLFGSAVEHVTALQLGYSFRFPARALEDVFAFVINERKCCPFLTFEILLAPGNGAVLLTLAGPPGTPAFLEAELPIGDTLQRSPST
jgi:hypothetical protein